MKCVLCEIEYEMGTRVKINDAKGLVLFNGDKMPVCQYHGKKLKKVKINEQPD